jgi:hypothetical protein
MRKLIQGLKDRLQGTQVYLMELLKSDDMILISRSEFEEDMNELKAHIEEVENKTEQVYVDEDRIRDAVHDAIYNLEVDSDSIYGMDDVQAECEMARSELSRIRRKYAPTIKEQKVEEAVDSAVNRIMDNNIDNN